MARTYRKLPYRYLRIFHGRKAALQRGDRRPPPDPWDDYTHSRETLLPYRLAERLIYEGHPDKYIVKVLAKRGITERRAREIVKTRRKYLGLRGGFPDR